MDVKSQFEYFRTYFGTKDLGGMSEQREIIERVLDGEGGNYKGVDYLSRQFKVELTRTAKDISDRLQSFRELIPPDKKTLIGVLNHLDIRWFMDFRIALNNISQDEWEDGERGKLKESYVEAVKNYKELVSLFE